MAMYDLKGVVLTSEIPGRVQFGAKRSGAGGPDHVPAVRARVSTRPVTRSRCLMGIPPMGAAYPPRARRSAGRSTDRMRSSIVAEWARPDS